MRLAHLVLIKKSRANGLSLVWLFNLPLRDSGFRILWNKILLPSIWLCESLGRALCQRRITILYFFSHILLCC